MTAGQTLVSVLLRPPRIHHCPHLPATMITHGFRILLRGCMLDITSSSQISSMVIGKRSSELVSWTSSARAYAHALKVVFSTCALLLSIEEVRKVSE